jgi:hypothetical protein
MKGFLLAAALVSLLQPRHYSSDDVHQAIGQIAEERGVNERFLDCVVFHESTYRPYAVGLAGEQGPVQLHPRGAAIEYRRRGYTDVWSPWQSIDFLAVLALEGRAAGEWVRSWRLCSHLGVVP